MHVVDFASQPLSILRKAYRRLFSNRTLGDVAVLNWTSENSLPTTCVVSTGVGGGYVPAQVLSEGVYLYQVTPSLPTPARSGLKGRVP